MDVASKSGSVRKYTGAMLRIYRDIEGPCLAPDGSVLAIGAFDGLHRGHAALLAKVRERATKRGLVAAAVSFEPLPRSYFSPTPLKRLSSVREKLCGFEEAGIETLLLLRFTAALVAMSAEDFVRQVLVARMGAREIWVGADFRFGHNRVGDVALLESMQGEGGYEVRVLDQPDFVNAAARLETTLTSRELLGALLAIETGVGRVRGTRNGPRVLDLDLLLYGDQVINEPDLVVPHPRLHERAFVLVPLAEIAPDLVLPGGAAVGALRAAITGQRVAKLVR